MSSLLDDVLILLTAWSHVVLTPYTKVEESFNLHATHDVLVYGLGASNITNYDHFVFPGAVPRSFLGSIILAWSSLPVILLLKSTDYITSKADLQIIGPSQTRTGNPKRLGAMYPPTRSLKAFWELDRSVLRTPVVQPVPSPILDGSHDPQHVRLVARPIARAPPNEVALLLAPLALHALLARWVSWKDAIKRGLVIGGFSVSLTTLLDSYLWSHYPLWPELHSLYFNVYQHKSAEWGTAPFHAYFSAHLPKLLLSSLPLSVLGAIVEPRVRGLMVDALVFVLGMSFLAHKEWRFVVYVVPLANVAAARGVHWLTRQRVHSILGRLSLLVVLGCLAANVLVTVIMSQVSMANYPGGVALMQLNEIFANSTQDVHVHISNLAAQTGASLFLQTHAPPYPSFLPTLESKQNNWIYNKTENLTPSDITSSRHFTHAIIEASDLNSNAFPLESWEVVKCVSAFDGFRVVRGASELGDGMETKEEMREGGIWERGGIDFVLVVRALPVYIGIVYNMNKALSFLEAFNKISARADLTKFSRLRFAAGPGCDYRGRRAKTRRMRRLDRDELERFVIIDRGTKTSNSRSRSSNKGMPGFSGGLQRARLWQQNTYIRIRSFYNSSIVSYPRPSACVRHPRWINTRRKEGEDEAQESEETQSPSSSNTPSPSVEAEESAHETALERDGSEDKSSRARLKASNNEDGRGRNAPPSSSSGQPPANNDGSDPNSNSNPQSGSAPPSSSGPSSGSGTSISKQSVPESYPQVLALPIARRPLFPGFYKAVVVRNPGVVAAIKEMMRRGQPYLGAFLLKDENTDSDVITDINSVHHVGVFAQITSVFAAQGKDEKEEGLTAVLYPHRRIKITGLVKPVPAGSGVDSAASMASVADVEEGPGGLPTPPPTPPPEEAEETGTDVARQQAPPVQTAFLQNFDISLVNVENLYTQPYNKDDQYIRAFMSEIVSVFKDIAQLNPLFRDQITTFSINQVATNVFDEPDKLADFAAAVSTGEVQELQDVLEALSVEDRLRKALLVLKKELINAQLQSKLSRDVDSKIAKRQREYYLMEQLKGIKKELGMESDGKDKLIEKFKERANSLKMPEGVRKVFDEELNKLMHLEPAASEANVTRNYLDWLTQIPWGVHSSENFSIAHAIKVLDEDHYGLRDVKDRILEFLAVGKLRGTVEGKILCFVGPPGVGKTSIGKSIARALNRQFFRFSVGGLTDIAEIKGHRRTYVGALPSKIIQALKRVGTENPLVLIDEVDKIGKGYNGDPASALLEMLDPEQNSAFLDHYMDVPVDLSHVLFVCTANMTDTIPAPLLDRMEVMEVSGYVTEEKQVIADKYLGPQAKEGTGLKDADVVLDPTAVDVLIKHYCRESGVRNLKKHIDKIYRKAALKIVQDLGEDVFPEPDPEHPETATTAATSSDSQDGQQTVPSQEPPSNAPSNESTSKPEGTEEGKEEKEKAVTTEERKPLKVPDTVHIRITPENLKDYVGPPVYYKDRMYGFAPPPGVSSGLGYLGNGSGALMPIEATSMPGKGGLQLTGKLGEVIRESAQIALSWVKAHAYELGITANPTDQFLNDIDIHVHMPEGSIGKEGPSAGTALLTAFVSLFTKTRVNPDIAMTGEISLVGQVLPVGGLKEKILAAHRAGMKTIIAPEANRMDIEENVPESVKTGIRFVYVEHVNEVLQEVFRGEPVAERWKDTLSL
ncbi:PIM1 [Sanghuangporus vaninii]